MLVFVFLLPYLISQPSLASEARKKIFFLSFPFFFHFSLSLSLSLSLSISRSFSLVFAFLSFFFSSYLFTSFSFLFSFLLLLCFFMNFLLLFLATWKTMVSENSMVCGLAQLFIFDRKSKNFLRYFWYQGRHEEKEI